MRESNIAFSIRGLGLRGRWNFPCSDMELAAGCFHLLGRCRTLPIVRRGGDAPNIFWGYEFHAEVRGTGVHENDPGLSGFSGFLNMQHDSVSELQGPMQADSESLSCVCKTFALNLHQHVMWDTRAAPRGGILVTNARSLAHVPQPLVDTGLISLRTKMVFQRMQLSEETRQASSSQISMSDFMLRLQMRLDNPRNPVLEFAPFWRTAPSECPFHQP